MVHIEKRIDKVLVLNLERRSDKRFAMYGVLRGLFVPNDCIEFFPAPDASDFKDSNAVVKAAIADGFEHFEKCTPEWIALCNENGWEAGQRGSLCCTWGFQRMYREVIRREQALMCMTDNFIPPYTWYDWQVMVNVISRFEIFQFCVDEDLMPDCTLPDDIETKTDNFLFMPWYPTIHPIDSRISVGLAGAGDCCTILSPQGAELLLNWCAKYPIWFVELVMWFLANQNPVECYSLNFTKIMPYETRLGLSKLTNKTDSERTAWK